MKPIENLKDLHQVEMWLVELKCLFEEVASSQPPDIAVVYEERAKEVQAFLDARLEQEQSPDSPSRDGRPSP